MKKYAFFLLAIIFVMSACADKSGPTFTSLKIDGVETPVSGATYTGSSSETVTLDWVVQDDEQLFEFITFIDTTGFEDRIRLHAQSISTNVDFVRVELSLRSLDSLSQIYFFGNPIDVNFTAIDDAQNKTNTIVTFTID